MIHRCAGAELWLLAAWAASGMALAASAADSPQSQEKTTAAAGKSATAKPSAAPYRYKPDRFAGRAGAYYKLVWGVDSLAVRWAESGEVIRFNYRVLDAQKAQTLNDQKAEPILVDPRAGVSLVVPSLEK